MRQGIERGMVLPRAVLDGYEVTMSSHVVERPRRASSSNPSSTSRHRRRGASTSGCAGRIGSRHGRRGPGLRAALTFFVDEYLPAARETLGASDLPDGEDYYAYQVRHFTTLDLTPQEVHEIGLAEVERIQREMHADHRGGRVRGQLRGLPRVSAHRPAFYAEDPEELLKEASYLAKKMDAQLPRFFKTLPRLPYGVEPVPDHIAPKYTAGRYVGAPRAAPAGYYWVNTYKLDSRPLYTLEALTLHEAVPGHHLQNALNNEQDDLPNFRQYSYISAFGEGWGLYSEWLGLEAGFYTDPYRNFGRLTYEMWRAARLVVDTGVHAMGWSRQQVIDFLASHTALSCTNARPRPTATSPGRPRRCPTRSASSRSRSCAPGRGGARRALRHPRVPRRRAAQRLVPLTVLEQEIDRFIEATREPAASSPSPS